MRVQGRPPLYAIVKVVEALDMGNAYVFLLSFGGEICWKGVRVRFCFGIVG